MRNHHDRDTSSILIKLMWLSIPLPECADLDHSRDDKNPNDGIEKITIRDADLNADRTIRLDPDNDSLRGNISRWTNERFKSETISRRTASMRMANLGSLSDTKKGVIFQQLVLSCRWGLSNSSRNDYDSLWKKFQISGSNFPGNSQILFPGNLSGISR